MRILRVIVDTRTHGNGTPESPFYISTEYTSLDGLLKKDSERGEPLFFEDHSAVGFLSLGGKKYVMVTPDIQ